MAHTWKHALVIGASSGIGKAVAEELISRGVSCALIARRADALEAVRNTSTSKHPNVKVLTYPVDVRSYDRAEALTQSIAKDLGGLDLIVYASGVMPTVGEHEYNFEKDREMVEVNLLGAFAWLNEAAKRFEQTKQGTIIGISSVAGDRGRRGNPAYCTTKAALTTYLESLRNRLARYGVNVVTVKPGFVDTEMTKGKPGLFWVISAQEAARQILHQASHGKNVVYVPARWRWVMRIIRMIPSAVFSKLGI